MCDIAPSPSFVCKRLNAWKGIMSRDLSRAAKNIDSDCYLMYRRSQMMTILMGLCNGTKTIQIMSYAQQIVS